jgi:hypothetical protein
MPARRSGWHVALLALVALAWPLTFPAADAASAWRRLDTPHFTVIGSLTDQELTDATAQFERFREVLAQLLPSEAVAGVGPAVVILFESEKAFDPFKPLSGGKPAEVSGVLVPAADLNYVALAAGSRGLRPVFHEYVHLAAANLRLDLPLWLTEGLAEYYSTFEVARGGRKATVGQSITSHPLELRSQWLSLDELRTVTPDSKLYNEAERRSVFYAQSWALVHYLLHGPPPGRDWFTKYISAIDGGAGEAEAWTRIFGKQPLETGLRDYVDRSQFPSASVALAERTGASATTVGALTDSDADAILGDFLSRIQREDDASARLDTAAARPDGSHARIALSGLRLRQKRPADARALLARVTMPGGNWLSDYAYGLAVAEAFDGESSDTSTAAIASAREALQRTLRTKPELAHAWHTQAGLALQAGDLDAARDASESATFLAPGRFEYTLRLGDVFLRRREYAKARSVMGPLLTNPRAAALNDVVRSRLASVAAAERDAAAPAPAPTPTESAPADTLDLRRLRAGEDRAEGMLTRIECARKSVTFHVRIDGRAVQFRADRFEDIEFVSYRDDLRGNMACGDRTPEDLVFVTWREGGEAVKGTEAPKTIVAVEFLPKDYKPKE